MDQDRYDQVALEGMVDRHGIAEVLWMLARVCADKADHLANNWDDDTGAKQWEWRMTKIESVASTLDQ